MEHQSHEQHKRCLAYPIHRNGNHLPIRSHAYELRRLTVGNEDLPTNPLLRNLLPHNRRELLT